MISRFGKDLYATDPLWGESTRLNWITLLNYMDLCCFFVVSLNKLLNKHWRCLWFEMPWHSCNITVMFINLCCLPYGHRTLILITRMKKLQMQKKWYVSYPANISWGKNKPSNVSIQEKICSVSLCNGQEIINLRLACARPFNPKNSQTTAVVIGINLPTCFTRPCLVLVLRQSPHQPYAAYATITR